MFFHIDESGNTGNNLFDAHQPRLSYGLISSKKNADVLCKNQFRAIQKIIGNERVHANELGFGGLVDIAPLLIDIQKKMKFDFDYYFINKSDYALVIFFDSVFDAGLNEAVKWDTYWTPLRYLMIYKLSMIFNEELLKEAWRLSIVKRVENYQDDIVNLLSELKERAVRSSLDKRTKELIIDAFDFGISSPLALDFGRSDQKIISPNAVGFQFVIAAISRRARRKGGKSISSIIVDRQDQFNNAQISTHDTRVKISTAIKGSSEEEKKFYFGHPLHETLPLKDISQENLEGTQLTILNSGDSIGLQIVDVYLWLANKLISDHQLPEELIRLWSLFGHRSLMDGISLEGMMKRFSDFEQNLPKAEDLTGAQRDFARQSVEIHRKKVESLRQQP